MTHHHDSSITHDQPINQFDQNFYEDAKLNESNNLKYINYYPVIMPTHAFPEKQKPEVNNKTESR